VSAPTRPDGTKPYEERDVALRPIVVGAAALLALTVLAFVIVWLLNTALLGREAARSAPASPLADYAPKAPPAPRLQENPRRDLARLRADEDTLLGTYGWIDREVGKVRIPVERAMALLAEDTRK
jgi:hypothetical protein